jgi:hypothetical protein
MIWYEQTHSIDDTSVTIIGDFKDSLLRIIADTKLNDKTIIRTNLYSKNINMWVFQEVLAEDILAKYIGVIKKQEQKLQTLVDKLKIQSEVNSNQSTKN